MPIAPSPTTIFDLNTEAFQKISATNKAPGCLSQTKESLAAYPIDRLMISQQILIEKPLETSDILN